MKSGDVNKVIRKRMKGWFKTHGFARLKGSIPRWEKARDDGGQTQITVANVARSWDKEKSYGFMEVTIAVQTAKDSAKHTHSFTSLLSNSERIMFRVRQNTPAASDGSPPKGIGRLLYRNPEEIEAWLDRVEPHLEEASALAHQRSLQIEAVSASETPCSVVAAGEDPWLEYASGMFEVGRLEQVKVWKGDLPFWSVADGRFLAVVQGGRTLRLLEKEHDYAEKWSWDLYPPLMPIAFHPEGACVLVRLDDAIALFDGEGEELARRVLPCAEACFSAQGLVWVLGTDDEGVDRCFLLNGATLETCDSISVPTDPNNPYCEGLVAWGEVSLTCDLKQDKIAIAHMAGDSFLYVSFHSAHHGVIETLPHPVTISDFDSSALYDSTFSPDGSLFYGVDCYTRLWAWAWPDGKTVGVGYNAPMMDEPDDASLSIGEIGHTEHCVYTPMNNHNKDAWVDRIFLYSPEDLKRIGTVRLWVPAVFKGCAGPSEFLCRTWEGLTLFRYNGLGACRAVLQYSRMNGKRAGVLHESNGVWSSRRGLAWCRRTSVFKLDWLKSESFLREGSPEILTIKQSSGSGSRFQRIGRCSSGPSGACQFMAFVTGADPNHPERSVPAYPDPSDPGWAWRKRWYGIVHLFDADGAHLGTAVRCGGTTAGGKDKACDRAHTMMREILNTLGSLDLCDIRVRPFEVTQDGYLFGLVYEAGDEDNGGHVMLWPNDIMFAPPYDGEYST